MLSLGKTTEIINMETKTCNKCGKTLPIENFAKKRFRSKEADHHWIYGLYNWCRECEVKRHNVFMAAHPNYNKEYHEQHGGYKPLIVKTCIRCEEEFTTKLNSQKYCSKTCISPRTKYLNSLTPEQRKEEQRLYCKQWHATNKERVKQWTIDNKERINAKARVSRTKWKNEHREEYNKRRAAYKKRKAANDPIWAFNQREYRRTYKKNRCETDINFRLAQNLRKKIFITLRYGRKYNHSLELLGCSIDDARNHIERQFQSGMTWDNWAMHGWHIDHIIPIASFDLSDEAQQKQCFHYTNLQPLWALDNHRKSDKIIEKQLCLI
jgi:hypothetical protein